MIDNHTEIKLPRHFRFALVAIGVLALSGLILVTVEAISVRPHYVAETATIKSVQDDPPWNYIGEDKRTLVQFSDGWTRYVSGDRGNPGETILTGRQRGTTSLLGWMGDLRE